VSAQRIAQQTKETQRRPALILITDGEDRASYYKQDQLFALLRENKVRVFVIGLVNQLKIERRFSAKAPVKRPASFLNGWRKNRADVLSFSSHPLNYQALPTQS
jgi:hypothetical protein